MIDEPASWNEEDYIELLTWYCNYGHRAGNKQINCVFSFANTEKEWQPSVQGIRIRIYEAHSFLIYSPHLCICFSRSLACLWMQVLQKIPGYKKIPKIIVSDSSQASLARGSCGTSPFSRGLVNQCHSPRKGLSFLWSVCTVSALSSCYCLPYFLETGCSSSKWLSLAGCLCNVWGSRLLSVKFCILLLGEVTSVM